MKSLATQNANTPPATQRGNPNQPLSPRRRSAVSVHPGNCSSTYFVKVDIIFLSILSSNRADHCKVVALGDKGLALVVRGCSAHFSHNPNNPAPHEDHDHELKSSRANPMERARWFSPRVLIP